MASDYNHFSLIGRLVRDCEIRYTATGVPVASFSIASNKSVKNGQDKVNYFDMNLWGTIAQSLEKYLTKGKQVQVSGEIIQDRWNDKASGQARSKIKFNVYQIQLLGGDKNNNTFIPQVNNQANNGMVNDPWKDNKNNDDDMGDEPF